jgi:hypothetical protein
MWTGNPDARAGDGWVEKWAIKEFLHDRIPFENCLSLCCGFGFKDRRMARLGMVKHCTSRDNSLDYAAKSEGHRHNYMI